MSIILVVHCDYGDGKCLNEVNGFDLRVRTECMYELLKAQGWLMNGGDHFYPEHATLMLKDT